MKKLLKNMIFVLMISLCMITVIEAPVLATEDMYQDAKEFISNGKGQSSPIDLSKMKETSNLIYSVLLTGAIIIAVAVAVYLGVQFMLATAEDKAQYKEALLPFVIGCFIVFGAFAIWSVVMQVGNSIDTASINQMITVAKL